MKPTTFTASRSAVTKAWFRKGKQYFRSFFDGKVRQVPKGQFVKESEA